VPNIASLALRVDIIRHLVEGTSVRGTARLCNTCPRTVLRLGVAVGMACLKLHDRLVRDIRADFIEVDEVWAFVGVHERRKKPGAPREWGDAYTIFGIDTDTKLVPSFLTGKRSLPFATVFATDLRERVRGKPQVSVDGWPHWAESFRRAFGHTGCHLGSMVKEYQKTKAGKVARHLSPNRVKAVKKSVIYGHPDQDFISTAIAERMNMTTRMTQRRLTRLTNGFSKKLKNLVAAVALHFFHYNFVREHESLGTTPAVKAGLAKAPWTLEEMVREALAEAGLESKRSDAKGA
jgi:hypothetical protein